MTQDSGNDRLSAVPLFSPMTPAALSALDAAAQTHRVAKGRDVEAQGDDLLVLLRGAVALNARDSDRLATLSTIRAPRALNLPCMVARADCQISWRALEPSAVLVLPGPLFRAALTGDAGLAARAYGDLAVDYQQLLSSAAGQRLKSAQRRLVDYLLSLIPGRRGKALVQLPYQKHLLASLLGMTPENFSRTLGGLADHGVSVRGADVDIDKVERLRAAVGMM